MEVLIPQSIIDILSIESGIPIYDENKSVSKFLNYLNMNTNRPVTFKEKTSTATEEFSMNYPLTIQYFLSDFTRNDVNKRGSISESCEITLSLTTEFNTVGLYEYIAATYSDALKKYDFNMKIDYSVQQIMVPFYTYDKMFSVKNEDGWKYFTSRMFRIMDEGGPDTFDISDIFKNTNVADMLAYHKEHSIPYEVFMDIKVMKGDIFLTDGKDFNFDFNTQVLTTFNVNTSSTYRFIIYVNNLYINELFEKINSSEMHYD